jgi:polygalacturonase
MNTPRTLLLSLLALATAGAAALRASDAVLDEHFMPALPVIPDRTFTLTDFGGVGDGRTMNTAAFEKAIAAVRQAGGGRLVVPKGVFRTLHFELCSGLDLHLDEGAVIKAPDSFAEYGVPDPAGFRTQAEANAAYKNPRPLITGEKLHDVAITGPGTIGAIWWQWSERVARAHPGRVVYHRFHLVVISGCERLHVADVTLTNSPMFHLVPSHITDLVVERVKVKAPFNAPNTDAIDPGPVTNALIRDCVVDTGDDDICIKSGGTNILVENCTIRHGHGISIGSETTRGVHHMLVRNCTIDGADNGLRIKSMRGAGGPVSDIRYENITMGAVANAFIFQLDYHDDNRPNFRGDPTKVPSIRGIVVENVTVGDAAKAGRVTGLPDSPIESLTFRNVRISAGKALVIHDAPGLGFENCSGF